MIICMKYKFCPLAKMEQELKTMKKDNAKRKKSKKGSLEGM